MSSKAFFVLAFVLATSQAQAGTTGPAGVGAAISREGPSLALNAFVRRGGLFGDIGEIRWYAGFSHDPDGEFLRADGRRLAIAGNEALYSKIGTTYGGDGRSTFALPNLVGRAASGASVERPLGTVSGVTAVSLGPDTLPLHAHGLPAAEGGATDPAGRADPDTITNRQPTLSLHYDIRASGIYPSGNGGGSIGSGGPDQPPAGTAPSRPPADFGGDEGYLGFMVQRADRSPVRGTLPADGRLLPIASNTALFSLLGTNFGGDGRTTFGLPDMIDRIPLGPGQGPGLSDIRLGGAYGTDETVLTAANLPWHDHASPDGPTAAVGSGLSFGNRQPSMGLTPLIAYEGIYPSFDRLTFGGGFGSPTIGEVALSALNYAPYGWFVADGRLLPISSHGALFSLLGTTYGGDGETTFGLPDLRGRTMVGAGEGVPLGSVFGFERTTLTAAQMPEHTHDYALPAPPPPAPVPLPAPLMMLASALGGLALMRRRAS